MTGRRWTRSTPRPGRRWGIGSSFAGASSWGRPPETSPTRRRCWPRCPPADFVIGSIHQLSDAYGCQDLAYAASADPEEARRQITDYLELVLRQAKWGKFSVQGHLTLPLRYINERRGGHMTFDGFEAEVEEIYRTLIANGCGIEVNTNRGKDPLPDEKWLRLYRECGGEIITLGSDAHRAEHVGCCIRERQELLRECGFRAFCTFREMKPVFHDL